MMSSAHRRSRRFCFVLLTLALAASFVLALLLGAVTIPPLDVLRALVGTELPGYRMEIIQSIRLPRALLAGFVGAILAICGAILQGLFRNPLADPSLIGVTAGASVGASLMIFLGAGGGLLGGFMGASLVSIGAFSGGLITVWLVYRVATGINGTSVATMLLMGIAVSALSASATGLLDYFADNEMLRRMSLWRMGGLDGANNTRAVLAGLVLLTLLLAAPAFGRALNTLLLGESQARHLGIDVERLKTRLIILVAAGVGTAVAVSGSIAFVGLVVPHMVRLWVGPDHRLLLPLSALGGAVLLLLADTLARTALAPTELPVGLVTALLGAPFFIHLLRQRRNFG
ncbi:iron ABC transporter permease [Marinimicrobium sp. ABcell2]|uniref:FecCD family ABC transporter permease n=1 Tax=Marinimicrobium sp. ABcell2 TaxID=3069751 RepID=UPI0027B54691|nr:iron ABC transporter permease [Marinimicrobium sp. ABcell2]MDQ2076731.1 iron ABC transporter permease [Marinimicrobium sp. ABcell2]